MIENESVRMLDRRNRNDTEKNDFIVKFRIDRNASKGNKTYVAQRNCAHFNSNT